MKAAGCLYFVCGGGSMALVLFWDGKGRFILFFRPWPLAAVYYLLSMHVFYDRCGLRVALFLTSVGY
jgi:hypothetical protein